MNTQSVYKNTDAAGSRHLQCPLDPPLEKEAIFGQSDVRRFTDLMPQRKMQTQRRCGGNSGKTKTPTIHSETVCLFGYV